METLIPWRVWGWYEDEATEGDDVHQVVHVDFRSIEYSERPFIRSGGEG